MSEFNKEGFLSTGINKWQKGCRNRYSEWFVLCEEFNQYCVKLTSKLFIRKSYRRQSLFVALFFKLLCIYQGSIILAEKCMANEVKILLRGLLEALFALRAIVVNKEVAEEYHKNHFLEKLRNLRRV
ncbi:DUF5677 domain-containing protein [Chloroflexota bacterium]